MADKRLWKKGRGKLGPFAPLFGSWVADADSEMGKVRCHRTFSPLTGGQVLRLEVRWELGAGKTYEEVALVGTGDDGALGVWSFTSDGKRSQGRIADVTDLHPEAVGFEADMPAGRARQAYWPAVDGDGFHWVVESRTKKGWNRFVEHVYRRAPDGGERRDEA